MGGSRSQTNSVLKTHIVNSLSGKLIEETTKRSSAVWCPPSMTGCLSERCISGKK